jgi:RimJ/RimL family protein N-acetyltransferase
MENQPILATGRLLLRPFDLPDAPLVQRLCGDYAVAATTLLPYPYPDGRRSRRPVARIGCFSMDICS